MALGDALGAPLEGGPIERLLWRFVGRTRAGDMRWTDDTQMSLDVAESFVSEGRLDADDLARRFAGSYRWSRGYGPGAAKLLKRIGRGVDWREASRSVFPDGSFGNGGAMRAPVVGLYFAGRPDELTDAARRSARVTHAHPLGVEGAVLVAWATASALAAQRSIDVLQRGASQCDLEPFTARLETASTWLHSGDEPPASEVRRRLGNGIAAAESCVTAVYIAARFLNEPFDEMLGFVASCRGDVDTIGAMAGAIWGAKNGTSGLPADKLTTLEQRDRIVAVADALHKRSGGPDADSS